MYFYPRTLKSEWYLGNVCDSIYASLEGAKNLTKLYYENEYERKHYVQTFEECQRLVKKYDLKPEAMRQALSDFHTEATAYELLPPFFSFARWFYDADEARENAIIVCFELVDSAINRFVW